MAEAATTLGTVLRRIDADAFNRLRARAEAEGKALVCIKAWPLEARFDAELMTLDEARRKRLYPPERKP